MKNLSCGCAMLGCALVICVVRKTDQNGRYFSYLVTVILDILVILAIMLKETIAVTYMMQFM